MCAQNNQNYWKENYTVTYSWKLTQIHIISLEEIIKQNDRPFYTKVI